MSDIILESYLKDFADQFDLESRSRSELFESFANLCTISRHYPYSFPLDDIAVSGGDDSAIDGIGIVVNNRLVTDVQEVTDIVNYLGYLEAHFILVQAKSSPKFESGEIGNFLFGAKSFFQPVPSIPENDRIKHVRRVKDAVYENSLRFRSNPSLSLYYVTTGEWVGAAPLEGRIRDDLATIKGLRIFNESVEFIPVDAVRLRELYQELNRKLVQEVEFSQYAILPKIDGVRQAFIGYLSCTEYLKLITDRDGNLVRSAFYENIRDYQGDNPVNQEIASTMRDPILLGRLPILNNGVTIVAKSIVPTGQIFRLHDYQIVNGCQTSHVLFAHRDNVTPGSSLPVKLIETADPDVTNLITKATNRQTEVKVEAFEALSPFHKKLEEFYRSIKGEYGPILYYERRSKQYEGSEVKRFQVVTLANQVRAFVGVVLDEPQSTHRYYGELLKAYQPRLFRDNHNLYIYYLAALLVYRIEQHIRAGQLPVRLKPFKYHLGMMYRHRGPALPPLSSKREMDKYCTRLRDSLEDRDKSLAIFRECAETISEVLGSGRFLEREADRSRAFTADILDRDRGGKLGDLHLSKENCNTEASGAAKIDTRPQVP